MVAINPNDAGVYTELNQLQKLKSKSNRDDPEALKKIAKDFEQIFLSMMLKSMRDANAVLSKDNFLNSTQVQFFEEMRDEQLSLEMAHEGGIGLADVLVKQLSGTLKKVPDSLDPEALSDRAESKPLSMERFKHPVTASPLAELQSFLNSAEQQRNFAADNSGGKILPLPERFDNPEQFVTALKPLAEKAARELGVEPRVLIAQAALETGWGKHISRDEAGQNSYNLFNIKADQRWSGARLSLNTTEYRNGVAQAEHASFRQYGSYQQSFDDYVSFVKQSPRYQQALAQADNPRGYLDSLQNAGYATDPRYADKVYEITQRPLMVATLDTQVR